MKLRTLFMSLLVVTPLAAAAAISETYSETHALSAGETFGLDNVNGDVFVEAWDADEVQIDYTIQASSQKAFDRITVIIERRNNGVHVDTEYAENKGGDWHHDHASVDYYVKVPRYANLHDVETVNGELEIQGVAGNVRGSSVNGDVTATGLEGNAKLDTVNGDVTAYFEVLAAGQTVSLDSVNGELEIYVPDNVDAEFSAESVHGRMKSDFGLTVEKGEYVGSSMYGTVGSGAAKVMLENVNGSIEVRRFK